MKQILTHRLRKLLPPVFLLLLGHISHFRSEAQTPVVNYPVAAQAIDRGTGASLLTVQVAFPNTCTATTVQVCLPATVTYVPGTVLKTAGTGSVITIAESNISNLRKPIFSLTGIAAAGDITFTIQRKAGCGAAATGKDTLIVNGSCGSVTENSSITNSYNFLVQSLGLTQAAAINNATINTNYTRTTTITNGGLGGSDTVRFYMVYPNAGIQLVANTLLVGATPFTPWRTNGDTLFFKFFGSIFGADNLLTNGESIVITENILLKKCGPTTTYAAYWGPDQNNTCTTTSAQSIITMAAPSLLLSGSANAIQASNFCRIGINDYTFNNIASVSNIKANTIYNPVFIVSSSGATGYLTLDSVKLNGTGANLPKASVQGGQDYPNIRNFFTSDPDGAGVGLDDMDGDGFYDDLPPGQSVTFRWYYTQVCSNVCGREYSSNLPSLFIIENMCGQAIDGRGAPLAAPSVTFQHTSPAFTRSAIPQITPGVPFTVNYAYTANGTGLSYHPTDSLYLKITLPSGLGLSGTGNVTINGVAIPLSDVIVNGNILLVRTKTSINSLVSYSIDFVYSTGAPCSSSDLTLPSEIYYVQDNTCACTERVVCNDFTPVNVLCTATCPIGASNISVVTERTTLGWTNSSMAAKVSPAAVTGAAKYTVMPKDTIRITTQAVENSNYNNLFYSFEVSKTSTNQNVLSFGAGTLTVTPAGGGAPVTCALAAPADNSTVSTQILRWNLSGCLPGGNINPNDQLKVDLDMVVTSANGDSLFGLQPVYPSFTNSYFSNMNGVVEEICGQKLIPALAFVGLSKAFSIRPLLANCTASDNSLGVLNHYWTVPLNIYPNEFRPAFILDSAVYIVPAGWSTVSGTQLYSSTRWTSPSFYTTAGNALVTPVINGSRVSYINPNNGSWISPEVGKTTNPTASSLTVYGQFRPTSCSPTPTSLGVTWYVRDYAYVPSQTTTKTYAAPAVQLSFGSKPSLTLVNNSNVVQGIKQQHFWDIEIRNINTAFQWLSVEPAFAGSGITVDSVVLKPTNTQLPVESSYAVSTGTARWYKVTPVTVGTIQQVRIYFKFTNCTSDSILVKSNWECSSYPSPNPTASCAGASLYLKVIPQTSELQAAVNRQPTTPGINLCTTDSVTVVVNSALQAYVANPVLRIFPTTNLNILPTFDIEYPLGSGNWQSFTIAPVAGIYNLSLNSHTAIAALSGLPGTFDHPLLTDRQVKVRISYQVLCGFVSGENIDFQVLGNQPCGIPAIGNGTLLNTNSINVLGANVAGTAGMTNNLSVTNIQCGQSATITGNITPLITGTSLTDTVVYTLPAGLIYAGNFTDVTGSGTSATVSVNGTTTTVKVKIPDGIAAGTPVSFTFRVTESPAAGCGKIPVSAAYQRSSSVLSCNGTPCSTSSPVALNTTNNELTIDKPDLTVSNVILNPSSGCTPGNNCNIQFTVFNTGNADAAAGVKAEIFCSGSSVPFGTVILPAIVKATSVVVNGSVTIPASCPLGSSIIVRIRPLIDGAVGGGVNCVCSDKQALSSFALPVKLVYFKGNAVNCNAALTWQTATETNSDRFEVEYSTDGISFRKVGMVKAAGNSTSIVNYQFAWPLSNGNNYFRLKMIDRDGKIDYSNIVALANSCTSNFGVLVYPNPLTVNTTVKVSIAGASRVNILVYSAAGQLVENRPSVSLAGQNGVVELNAKIWAPGMYMIRVINSSTREEKVVKFLKE